MFNNPFYEPHLEFLRKRLPTFKGYAVDYAGECFRKYEQREIMECVEIIPFLEGQGPKMFKAWLREEPKQAICEIKRISGMRGFVKLGEHFYIDFAKKSLRKEKSKVT